MEVLCCYRGFSFGCGIRLVTQGAAQAQRTLIEGTRYLLKVLCRGVRAEAMNRKEGNSFLPSTCHASGLVLEALYMHSFY